MRLAEEYGLAWYCDWDQEPPVWVFTDKVPDMELAKGAPVLQTMQLEEDLVMPRIFRAGGKDQSLPPDMVHEFAIDFSTHVGTFSSRSLGPYDGKALVSDSASGSLDWEPLNSLGKNPLPRGFRIHGDIPSQESRDWLYTEKSTDWLEMQGKAMQLEAARSASAGLGGTMAGSLGCPFPGWVFGLQSIHPESRFLVTSTRLTASYHPQSLNGDPAMHDWVFTKQGTFGVRPCECRFVPARCTPVPRIPGVRLARVVGYGDQENGEPAVGRCGAVLVRMDWLGDGEQNPNRRMARVCQPWAGDGYGTMFWPRVGSEVAVAFEQGDPDRPIIVGSLYSAWNKPPESTDCIPHGWVSGIVSQPKLQGDVERGKNNFIKILDDEHCQISMHSVTTPFEVSSLNSFRIVKGGQVNVTGWPF